MKKVIIAMIGIAVAFSACKKNNDNNNNNGNSGTFTAHLTNSIDTWNGVVFYDTLTVQNDTETNGGTNLVPPQKVLHIYAKATDSSVIDIKLKDYTNVSEGSCLRTVNYLDANYASEYVTFNSTRYYTTANVTYTINSASPKTYVGDSGVVTITACSGSSVTGTIQYRLYNTASPNDTIRITSGSFTNASFVTKTYNATFAANVDAVPWLGYVAPNNANNVLTIATDGNNNDFNDKQLTLIAEDVNGKRVRLTIYDVKNVNDGVHSIRTTTYVDRGSSTDTVHSGGNTIKSYVLARYDGNDADNSTVTITSCDATNMKVSGTFSFHVSGGVFGTDHTISNGSFNNVSYRIQ